MRIRSRGDDKRLSRKERVQRVPRLALSAGLVVLAGGIVGFLLLRGWDPVLGAVLAVAIGTTLVTAHVLRELGGIRISIAEIESMLALEPLRQGEVYPINPATLAPENAFILCREILYRRPHTVIELGSGTSSLLIGRCLKHLGGEGRRLISLEHHEEWCQDSREKIARAGLEGIVTICHAPLKDYEGYPAPWYDLDALPKDLGAIDLVLVDGPEGGSRSPLARYGAFPALRERLADDALLLVDDGLRKGEKELVARWAEECPHLTADLIGTKNGLWRVEFRRSK